MPFRTASLPSCDLSQFVCLRRIFLQDIFTQISNLSQSIERWIQIGKRVTRRKVIKLIEVVVFEPGVGAECN